MVTPASGFKVQLMGPSESRDYIDSSPPARVRIRCGLWCVLGVCL